MNQEDYEKAKITNAPFEKSIQRSDQLRRTVEQHNQQEQWASMSPDGYNVKLMEHVEDIVSLVHHIAKGDKTKEAASLDWCIEKLQEARDSKS